MVCGCVVYLWSGVKKEMVGEMDENWKIELEKKMEKEG